MYSPELSIEHREWEEDLFTESDKDFLTNLGCAFDANIQDCVSLENLNELLEKAFVSGENENGELDIEELNARIEFFDHFALLQSSTREALIHHPEWPLTRKSVIGVLRLIHNTEGVNIVSALDHYPKLLSIEPSVLKFRMDNIAGSGVKLVRVFNKFSPALGLSSDTFNSKLDELTQLKLNARQVVTIYPPVVGMSSSEVNFMLKGYSQLGVDAIKLINEEPNMLRPNKVAQAKTKMFHLRELGLNAPMAVNNFPPLLTAISTELTKKVMRELQEIGLDAQLVMNKFPLYAMTLRVEDFKNAQGKFTRLGLDAKKIIEGDASLVTKPEEAIALRMAEIADLDLDPVNLLNSCPDLMHASSKALKTRHRVIASATRAWGVTDYLKTANDIIEKYPPLLSFTSDRLRVIERILNQSLEPGSRLELSHIKDLVRFQLEPTITGYLEAKDSLPMRPERLIYQSSRFRKLDKVGLLKIIFDPKNASDPVIKTFMRGRARNNKPTENYHEHI
jgi:hypothetical protein